MGGKSRKTGGISKKLVQDLVKLQKQKGQEPDKKRKKDDDNRGREKGLGLTD